MSHSLLNITVIIISFYKGGVMDKVIYQKSSYRRHLCAYFSDYCTWTE